MSTRQVGYALGVGYDTVQRDMKSSDRNRSDESRKVQSSDGITRTYTTKPKDEWQVGSALGVAFKTVAARSRLEKVSNLDTFAERVDPRTGNATQPATRRRGQETVNNELHVV